MVIAVLATVSVVFRWSLQGRFAEQTDQVGSQFSPAWSNFTATTTTHERTATTREVTGETTSTLLDHAFTRVEPYVDDFSNQPMRNETTYE